MSPTVAEIDRQLTAAGQPFEVTEVDIGGVSTKVWLNAPATLVDILRASKAHGNETFLVYEDDRMSFIEHFEAAAQLASILVERFGVAKGDRVAIAMRNYPEWSVAFWATVAAGAVAVPLNAWWTGEELAYGLADSGLVVVFADVERSERIAAEIGSLPDLSAVIVVRSDPDRSLSVGDGAGGIEERTEVELVRYEEVLGDVVAGVEPPPVPIVAEDDATIFYTSGTTGRPKGALGTHRNICTNPMSLFFVATRQALRAAGTDPAPRSVRNSYLLSVPLFHATGCHSVLVVNALAGGQITMMFRFDAGRALELIEREKVTIFGGVPAMAMQILDHPDFAIRDTSSVRTVGYGGAPAPPDLVRRIKAHFPGGSASNGYGLTETSSLSTMNNGDDYVERPTSVGPPVPVVEVQVVDPLGVPLPPGDIGELWIKGPNVVKGYWGKPEATAATFSDGWLHTGDIARLDDDNFVYIVDRAKDMLIRGGENVYCVEIESVLHDHPAVADAAVIGIPHPVLGEEVGAVVQLRSPNAVSEEDLRAHVATHLASFKVPSRIWFVDEPLPRNPAGKILKRQLRDELLGAAT